MAEDEPQICHTFEPAPSGRAKCRGCGEAIAKGEIRFGERLENPYGGGVMTLWFHPMCVVYKRPEPFLEALSGSEVSLEDGPELEKLAQVGLAHRRLPRLNGAEKSPSGRARCRSCREVIPKDSWRFSLVYYDLGRFEPSGFIHARCAQEYFGTTEVVDRVGHFTKLSDEELEEVSREVQMTDASRRE